MVFARGIWLSPLSRFAGEGWGEGVTNKEDEKMRDNISLAAKQCARAMRREPTFTERKLWYALRDWRLQSLKFRRQAPMGPYIVDFICIAHRLVVEVDGSQHAESPRDETRNIWLMREGYRVMRFWNNEVTSNKEGVLATIAAACGLPW